MHRHRALRPDTQIHESETAFLAAPATTGAHAIRVGTEWLDVSYIDRGASHTLVCFHSALTDHVTTVPAFSGRRVADQAGMNLISVADPALERGDIDLAWFLGTRGTGVLRHRLSPVIRHILGTRKAVLFGASGGGYASILFGQDFPGHTVVSVNPRLYLGARPRAAVSQYIRVAHGVVGATPIARVRGAFVVDDLAAVYRDGLTFDLHLLQNQGDEVYRRHHAEPFITALAGDPRLRYVEHSYGVGHRPIPTDLLVGYLHSIVTEDVGVASRA